MNTVKELHENVFKFTLSPEKARKRLVEIRDLINELIECESDAKRMRIKKKLENRLFAMDFNLDLLICWSKISTLNDKYWENG